MELTKKTKEEDNRNEFLVLHTFLPSLAWQLTLVDVNKLNNFSSLPDLAISSNSSFRYSPD